MAPRFVIPPAPAWIWLVSSDDHDGVREKDSRRLPSVIAHTLIEHPFVECTPWNGDYNKLPINIPATTAFISKPLPIRKIAWTFRRIPQRVIVNRGPPVGGCNRQMSISNLEWMLVMLMNAATVRTLNARKLKQVH